LLGGTSAIGAEILRGLARDGYTTLFTYHRHSEVSAALEAELGPAACAEHLDLASDESVSRFLSRVEAFGAIDALINSAGVTGDGLCMDARAVDLLKLTRINYLAPALIGLTVAASMSARRTGCILHITSIAGRRAKIGNALYGAAKIALERFTASLALEVARFNVRTLCIAPAFVDTPMFASFAGPNRERIIRDIPARRILQPADVARVALEFVQGKLATTGTTITLGNGEAVFW
jgi:3-oxoacyl-[acyl-carrier protein] reductase